MGDSYIWWMAWRYLAARKQKSGLSFMTTVSILGVAIGVAALIVVLSVMGGFEGDLIRKMLSGEPNVEIISKENAASGFSLNEVSLEKLQAALPEAKAMAPFTSSEIVLKRKTFLAAANLYGVRPEDEGKKLWAFDGAVIEGSLQDLAIPQIVGDEKLPGIILGDQLALQIGADVGDKITVLSPQANIGVVLGGGTIAREFVVVGKIATGMFNYDGKWAISNLTEGQRFLPDFDESLINESYVTGIGVNVRDPLNLKRLKAEIEQFPGLTTHTWQETNRGLLFALKLEKFTMGSILMLIVLVAAFSICGTMMMTVFHKRQQVSILCSIGMSRRQVAKLFMAHGFTIGTVGVLLGVLFGLGICTFIYYFKAIPLPSDVYYLKALPVRFLPLEYFIICSLTWIFALVASTAPALMAAGSEPSAGLRYE